MRICALLDDEGYRRIQSSLPASDVLRRLAGLETLRELQTGSCGALIVDPCVVRGDMFTAIISAASQGGEAVLLYVRAQSAVAIERALEAARQFVVEVVIAENEDEPAVLRARLADMTRQSIPAMVLRGVADALANVPPALQSATVHAFGWDKLPKSTSRFASVAGSSVRTVNRWLERAGLRSCGLLLTTARLARTWEPLSRTRDSLVTVIEIADIGSVRALTLKFDRIIGLPPGHARSVLRADAIAHRLVVALRR